MFLNVGFLLSIATGCPVQPCPPGLPPTPFSAYHSPPRLLLATDMSIPNHASYTPSAVQNNLRHVSLVHPACLRCSIKHVISRYTRFLRRFIYVMSHSKSPSNYILYAPKSPFCPDQAKVTVQSWLGQVQADIKFETFLFYFLCQCLPTHPLTHSLIHPPT